MVSVGLILSRRGLGPHPFLQLSMLNTKQYDKGGEQKPPLACKPPKGLPQVTELRAIRYRHTRTREARAHAYLYFLFSIIFNLL